MTMKQAQQDKLQKQRKALVLSWNVMDAVWQVDKVETWDIPGHFYGQSQEEVRKMFDEAIKTIDEMIAELDRKLD